MLFIKLESQCLFMSIQRARCGRRKGEEGGWRGQHRLNGISIPTLHPPKKKQKKKNKESTKVVSEIKNIKHFKLSNLTYHKLLFVNCSGSNYKVLAIKGCIHDIFTYFSVNYF